MMIAKRIIFLNFFGSVEQRTIFIFFCLLSAFLQSCHLESQSEISNFGVPNIERVRVAVEGSCQCELSLSRTVVAKIVTPNLAAAEPHEANNEKGSRG